MTRIICLACLALSTAGCSALNVQRPTAAVTGMAVQDVTPGGFTMNFGLDLTNPNAVALPLTGADYQLGLAGVNAASGTAHPDASLPANGTAHVMLPVTLTYDNLLAAEGAITKTGGDVPYTLGGGLSFGTKNPLLGNVRVPVSYSGVLALKQVLNDPQAVMQSPAARRLAQDLMGSFFGR